MSPIGRDGSSGSLGVTADRSSKLGPLPKSDGSFRASGRNADAGARLGGANGAAALNGGGANGAGALNGGATGRLGKAADAGGTARLSADAAGATGKGAGFRASGDVVNGGATRGTPQAGGLYFNKQGTTNTQAGFAANGGGVAGQTAGAGFGTGDAWGNYPYAYNYHNHCGNWGWGGWGGWGWGWGIGFGWGWGGWGWGGWGWGWPFVGIGWGGCGWNVGFGFGYSPAFWGGCSYPYYRCYDYYPYHYYATSEYYPDYAQLYHSDAFATDYADVSDPYAEITDETSRPAVNEGGGLKPLGADSIPEALRTPLYEGFPDIRSAAELDMRGESWMKAGRYLEAAEARRRQLLLNPTNPAIAVELGIALFAAEKYELSSIALNEALDLDPRVVSTTDLVASFGSQTAIDRSLNTLERYVVKNATDGSARFVLGSMDLAAGRYFAARNEFSLLKEAAPQNPHVANMLAESDRKFLEAAPETR